MILHDANTLGNAMSRLVSSEVSDSRAGRGSGSGDAQVRDVSAQSGCVFKWCLAPDLMSQCITQSASAREFEERGYRLISPSRGAAAL